MGLIGPPRSSTELRGNGKEGDGEGGEASGGEKAEAEGLVEKKKGEEGDENSFDSE